jgi:hypothetical protein
VTLALLSPGAAYEVAMMVNGFVFLVWLVLPVSYNSQLVERFEMSRLFAHPIRFRSIVVGSTLMSMLTMTGLWTVPLIVGQVVGLAWHKPLALPMLLLGALPTFALLVLTGRIVDDLFDLVAGDRRLRALALALLSVPFMLCWASQYALQNVTGNYQRMPEFLQNAGLEQLAELEEPQDLQEFIQVSGSALEIIGPSRILVWLPPGWATSGMALAVRGEWGRALAFLVGSTVFVGALLWLHARVTKKLMDGAALGIGAERVKRRRLSGGRSPGPAAFWALFRKDWSYLWRSPMPRRLVFSAVMMAAAIVFPLREATASDLSPQLRRAVPVLAFSFAATMVGMATNIAMTANYFGTFDREGFATLALAPTDRRYTLLSANLAILFYGTAQDVVIAVVVALLTRSWVVVPVGLLVGACLHVGSMPVCNLVTILAPYRAQLKYTSGSRQGNVWGLLAWAVSAPPVLAMILLPYVFWQPGLILAVPLAIVYCGALYALTLRPLARLLQRREHSILEAVTAQE